LDAPVSAQGPLFDRLEEVDGHAAAWFVADIRNDVKVARELLLEPSLVVDGASAVDEAAGYPVPVVLAVLDADGNPLGDSAPLAIGGYAGRVQLLIQLPADGAVMVKASVEAAS
jgi:hypothetical protein